MAILPNHSASHESSAVGGVGLAFHTAGGFASLTTDTHARAALRCDGGLGVIRYAQPVDVLARAVVVKIVEHPARTVRKALNLSFQPPIAWRIVSN